MGCLVELDGVRLAYSGDTRPVPRLIEAAQGADVLVHEAGGLDQHAAEIHTQGHSTVVHLKLNGSTLPMADVEGLLPALGDSP